MSPGIHSDQSFLLCNKTLTSWSPQNFLLEVRVKQKKLWAQAVLCSCPHAGVTNPNFCEAVPWLHTCPRDYAKLVCGHEMSQNVHRESQECCAVDLRARSPPSPKPTPLLAPRASYRATLNKFNSLFSPARSEIN